MNSPYHSAAFLNATDYKTVFPEIRTILNWRRFEEEKWPVARSVITARADLLALFTCLRSSLGRPDAHFLHWLFSRKMPVGEVLEQFRRIPRRDAEKIDHFRAIYTNSSDPVRLMAPAYQLANGRYYLLDANHRCCALAAANRPFELELYAICGPLERDAQDDVLRCRTR